MSEAFVLINCALGQEDEILNKLKRIEEIKEVSKTYGVYDIVARVQSHSENDLTEIISTKISDMGPVDAVLTLLSN